jgi:hypothetical protein
VTSEARTTSASSSSAAALARNQLPSGHALLLPQALEHEGRVGRVEQIELLLELGGVLALHERLHERVLPGVRASGRATS